MKETQCKKKYELILLTLFFLCWGFIFFDRLAIIFLMPVIQSKMNLTNIMVGQVSFVSTACIAISAVVFGAISDRSGYRKKWLVPFVFITGIFSALSGVVGTFQQLLIVRAIVGIGQGPILPLIMAMMEPASSKNNFGRNTGIIFCGDAIIANVIGPVVTTQLASITTWGNTLILTALPTLIVGFLIVKFAKEVNIEENKVEAKESFIVNFLKLFKYRNINICILISIFTLGGYWILMLFAPLYLTNIAMFSVSKMGIITSFMGAIFILYSLVVPKLSDDFGRKPILLGAFILCILAPLGMYLYKGNTLSVGAYVIFGGISGTLQSLFITLIPMETLPENLKVTGSAVIMSFGEIIGGALLPLVAGKIADSKGLIFMMLITAIIFSICVIISAFLTETNPSKINRTTMQ